MLPGYHPYMHRRIAKEILSRGTEAQQGGGGAEPGAPPLPNLRAMLHKVVLCMWPALEASAARALGL